MTQTLVTQTKAVSLLSRVILPRPGEPLDVCKLYIEESVTNARRAHPTSRTTLQIGAESEVSFATYFNAFPASYWRRWSTVTSVVLKVELTGTGRVDLYRSKATGTRIALGGIAFGDGSPGSGGRVKEGSAPVAPEVVEFEVGLEPFEDGGWVWFDVTTHTPVVVHAAGWYASVPAPGEASVAVGIPTFNRPDDCVDALRALTSDPLVDEVVKAVIVPDQGKSKLREHPQFPAVAATLGSRLSIHDQPNLGGSGGYSRVMYEAVKNTACQQILFMDDDIRIEPDSILRVLALNRFAKVPTLVGGQMLNLQEPSHLHVMGEVVDRADFMWTAAPHAEYDHDFARKALSHLDSKELHRRIDVDYNGWWMCMIPRAVAEELGQPLPLFIKWDDAEYGLRAAESGYPTVTLPGAAIWHMAWSDKDDAIDWQAYFHLRNRLVVAALHWDGSTGGLVRSTVKATLKHLSCLEYSTVAIQNKAIDDFLAGPEHIFSILESALPDVHRIRKQYPDAVVLPGATALPMATGKVEVMKPPTNPVTIAAGVARGILHNLRKADPAAGIRPQFNIATQDARWFRLCQLDGATVTTADGRGVVYRQRNRATMFRLLTQSVCRNRQLARRFPEMRRIYRAALPELSSRHRWESVLLENDPVFAADD